MRRVAQAPSHYEVELHQNERTGAAWRSVRRVGPDGVMSALAFATLAAAQTYAKRMNRRETAGPRRRGGRSDGSGRTGPCSR